MRVSRRNLASIYSFNYLRALLQPVLKTLNRRKADRP